MRLLIFKLTYTNSHTRKYLFRADIELATRRQTVERSATATTALSAFRFQDTIPDVYQGHGNRSDWQRGTPGTE